MPRFLILLAIIFSQNISFGQTAPANNLHINPKGATLNERIIPPEGFTRVAVKDGSYAAYLRNSKLKPHGAKVHYYDGREKENNAVYIAVVDMNIGTKNLQQCADVIMHIRAEYLYQHQMYDQIHFKFTNGFRADYSKWKAGYRIKVSGNNTTWVKTAAPGNDLKSFYEYMDLVYNYCGTLSLSKELVKVSYENMQPGDILIKGGSPGHAELVMDMAQNSKGKKVYLLAQSYMPAQEMQILQNPKNKGISPWYELDTNNTSIPTPEWDFQSNQLMRFTEN